MAGHHDEHHSTEKKPVSFTVPFILASITLIITLLFLSLCDPKPHDNGDHHGGVENKAHQQFEGNVHNPNAPEGSEQTKSDAATSTTSDSLHTADPAEQH